MMQQQTDTLTHTMDTAATQQPAAHHELTPAEVLSWLPRTATPAQMDSAIRANIKPCKITWSQSRHAPSAWLACGEELQEVQSATIL